MGSARSNIFKVSVSSIKFEATAQFLFNQKLGKLKLYLYINLACLFVCLFVCLYPINVITAEPIKPNKVDHAMH